MEMDIYERDSLAFSISNLAMLKLFHDNGVNVDELQYTTYMVNVQFDIATSMDIFTDGIRALFNDVEVYDYQELEESDVYQEINDGTPEGALIIKDELFQEVLNSRFADEFITFANKRALNVDYTEIGFTVIQSKKLFVIQIWFPGMLHEVVLALLEVMDKARELNKKTNGCDDVGISDKANRPTTKF